MEFHQGSHEEKLQLALEAGLHCKDTPGRSFILRRVLADDFHIPSTDSVLAMKDGKPVAVMLHCRYWVMSYVSPEARRTGLGKAMYAELTKNASEEDLESFYGTSWSSASACFYDSIGILCDD
jgi:GNAT superfamily N-acetyltransferase